jgi:DNA-binding SARP family transcriptional activator
MPELRITLLDSFQVLIDGQPIDGLAYTKARALLAYLLVEAGRPHQRDTLATMLWLELSASAAHANLRLVLANLHEALSDEAGEAPLLLVSRDSIAINPHRAYVLDVAEVEQLLATCHTHRHRGLDRCPIRAGALEQVVVLSAGEFFAEVTHAHSEQFAEWATVIRQHLHRQISATRLPAHLGICLDPVQADPHLVSADQRPDQARLQHIDEPGATELRHAMGEPCTRSLLREDERPVVVARGILHLVA